MFLELFNKTAKKKFVVFYLFIYQLNIRVFLSHDNSWNETGLFVFLHLWESMRYWVVRPQANLSKSPLKSSHWRRNMGPAVLIMRACQHASGNTVCFWIDLSDDQQVLDICWLLARTVGTYKWFSKLNRFKLK